MVSNPMTVDDFVGLFFVADWKLLPNDKSQFSGSDGAGVLYSSRRAPNSWSLQATTQDLTNAQTAVVRARLGALSSELCFLAYDRTLPVPPLDLDGAGWDTATDPEVSAVVDRKTLSFSGFPNSYAIAAGTMIGLLWDTDRRYLGSFLDDVTTTSGGLLASAKVTPAIPDSIAAGAVVELVRPLAKFKVVPRSLGLSWSSGRTSRWSFKAESTYEKTA